MRRIIFNITIFSFGFEIYMFSYASVRHTILSHYTNYAYGKVNHFFGLLYITSIALKWGIDQDPFRWKKILKMCVIQRGKKLCKWEEENFNQLKLHFQSRSGKISYNSIKWNCITWFKKAYKYVFFSFFIPLNFFSYRLEFIAFNVML